jgi:TRAP-type uncharacterized transport system substrate-binding protein
MPSWLRIILVAGLVVLVTATGLFGYRWYYRPTTLTVAVGSLDGEAARIVSAIAGRLAATNAGVRLNVIETSRALEAANAFSSGKTALALVRGGRPGSSYALASPGKVNKRWIHFMPSVAAYEQRKGNQTCLKSHVR